MKEAAVYDARPRVPAAVGGTVANMPAGKLPSTIRRKPERAPAQTPRSETRRLVVVGLALGFALFGGFGVWAGTMPLRGAVVATGVVKVPSKRKAVQHLEGGIIKNILVREGDTVERGQVLAVLDTAQLEAEIGVYSTKLLGDLALDARLTAESTRAATITFPKELLESKRPEARISMQSQEAEFAARAASLEGQQKQLDQQLAQLADTIKGYESQSGSLKQQLEYIQEEIRDTDALLDKGLARKPRVLALRRAESDLQSQLSKNQTSIAESTGKIAEITDRRRSLVFDRDKDIANQARTNLEDIGSLRHRIAATREKIDLSVIRAPEGGTIVALNTRDTSAVLAPRETLLEIVPKDEHLAIEVQIKPLDRDEVRIGQIARVRVLALNVRRTPMLDGKVSMVAADAIADPRSAPSAQTDPRTMSPTYKAEIELRSDSDLSPYLSLLQPGMPVEVYIETRERTFAEYLLEPFRLSIHRAFRES